MQCSACRQQMMPCDVNNTFICVNCLQIDRILEPIKVDNNKCKYCSSDNILLTDDYNYTCFDCGKVNGICIDGLEHNQRIIKSASYRSYCYYKTFFLNSLRATETTNLLTSDVIKLVKDTYKSIPTRKQIVALFKSNRYTKHYYLLLKIIYDKSPPLIHFNDKQFDVLQEKFRQLAHEFVMLSKEKNRKYLPHYKYLNYQLIRLLYPEEKRVLAELQKVSNNKTIEKYNNIWIDLCQLLKWRYLPYTLNKTKIKQKRHK